MGQNCKTMAPPIYGSLICQNGVSEILRCIESVYPYVDKYYIMDGGSSDGTWELLNKYKDVYNLELFQHPYKDQGDQRNRLLSKIPRNSWIINIDQDEQLVADNVRGFVSRITPKLYTDDERHLPLTMRVECINLVKDILHYDADRVMTFATKFFFYDRNVHFTPGYHMSICYFETESNTNAIPVDWIVKHYAYLDPARKESYKDPKRHYDKDEWDESKWNIKILPAKWR